MPYFDIELETLRCLDSFVQPRDRKVLEQLVGDIYVTGLYINSPDDYLVFSLGGIHWVHDTKVEWIEFQSIVSIDLPADDLERVLHLTMRDDTIVPLLIANDTEGEPDLFVVRDFLVETIYWPHASRNPEDVTKIESREDLCDYLSSQKCGLYSSEEAGRALHRGFPQEWQLRLFNIGEDLLARPDIWRLLALFLSQRIEEPVDHDRAEGTRPSTWRRHEYFLVGAESPEIPSEQDLYQAPEPLPDDVVSSLSDAAVEVLSFAESDAKNTGRSCIGSEHILLGLIYLYPELSCRILKRHISFNALRTYIKKEYESQMGPPTTDKLLFSANDAVAIMKYAYRLCKQSEDESSQLSPEHILTAIDECVGEHADVLLDYFDETL